MPQSLANVLVHLVFSTKDRAPVLDDDIRPELFAYLVGVLRNHDCVSVQVGGIADHVHILFKISRKLAISSVVEKLKVSTAKWLKTRSPILREFAWQAGYGAFSVSPAAAPEVVRYIQNQQEHHRKVSFEDELRSMLNDAGIPFDEKYLWD